MAAFGSLHESWDKLVDILTNLSKYNLRKRWTYIEANYKHQIGFIVHYQIACIEHIKHAKDKDRSMSVTWCWYIGATCGRLCVSSKPQFGFALYRNLTVNHLLSALTYYEPIVWVYVCHITHTRMQGMGPFVLRILSMWWACA